MSNKSDLQTNNLVLGTAPAGLLGGLNNVKDALEDKGITVTQSGTNPTFGELVDAIDDVVMNLPEEIDNPDDMDALLVAGNVGKAYIYTGTTTSDYTQGDIYVVEEVV